MKVEPFATYSFNNFIVGTSDDLVHKITNLVTGNEARHSPLFVYGGRGLGKTHLLHAIENHVAQHCSALYITGEEFTNEWIRAVHERRDVQFKSKYCDTAECLFMDNVQFLAPKEQMQNIFLRVIQSLHEKNTLIAVSADVPPQDINGLNPQLQKYFLEGTIVELQPPGDVQKHKVLVQQMRQCHGDTIPVSDDVMEWVVQSSPNFHDLFRYANRLNAYIEWSGEPVTMRDAHILADPL